MDTERFIRLAAGLHVLAALSFPLVLLTPHHDDTASQVFLVALLVAGTWARTWSLLHAEGSASWATTFRDGGVIAVAALLACWSTLASGALLGREGLLSLRSDSAWEHVLVPVLVGLLTSLICYLTPLLVAAPLLGIPLGLVHVARSVHRERLSGGAGPVGLAAEWTGALPPVERATVRKASADTGRNLGYDPMLVAGIWAARRPVRILALGAHGLGFDLLVLAVVRSAPLGGLSRIVVGALGLLLIVGTAIGGVALSALAGQVRPGAVAAAGGTPHGRSDPDGPGTAEDGHRGLDTSTPPADGRSPLSLRKRFGPGSRASDPDRRRTRSERRHRD